MLFDLLHLMENGLFSSELEMELYSIGQSFSSSRTTGRVICWWSLDHRFQLLHILKNKVIQVFTGDEHPLVLDILFPAGLDACNAPDSLDWLDGFSRTVTSFQSSLALQALYIKYL